MRLIALLLAVALAAPAASQPNLDDLFARWSSPSAPGCAVAVAKDGRTIIDKAYGGADLEHGVANTPATIFEAGSVSKQFTAAAILLLVEDGKLKLDDDVRQHVPELSPSLPRLTLDHLINHTSGLRDWGSVMDLAGWPRGTRAYTPPDVLDIIARQQALNYPPGAEYSYTNSGYNLMALIVERVSGQTLAAFTAARLFAPMGMTNTSWRDDFRRVVPGRAIAYERDGETWTQAMPFEDAYGNGGLLTTTADLLRWNDALTAGRLGAFVTSKLQERAHLTDGTPITYARGLFVDRWRNREQVAHSGSTGGYRAWLGRLPDEKLSVALLCNAGDVSSTMLAHQVIDRMLGVPEEATLPPAPVNGGAGTFIAETTHTPVTLIDDAGTLRIKDGPSLAPLPNGRLRGRGGEVAFEGRDRFVLHTPEGNRVAYRRVAPWAPAAADLAALAGRYRSDEADATYVAFVESGALKLRHDRRPGLIVTLAPITADLFDAEGDGIVRVIRDGEKISALSFGVSRVRDLRLAKLP
ncbi:serine hydrolase domain-containing protein [Sphingoaurantiacus capsulatus]|uniref:Serine hydrolase domain-containing protein n=1 Tax=Sphingoaurantiacus capsulatus TaxID=1771310 RepID=A0ABV7X6G9_9SPHN